MKRTFYIGGILSVLLFSLSGCYKTCESAFAPNYTQKGDCIDLTNGITGTYTGTFNDSIVGLHNTSSPITVQVTKVDDGHVQIASSGTAAFTGFTATVNTSANGYLTVSSQTASNGLTVTGAGAYFGSPADGVFVTAQRQLTIYVLAGTQYEVFSGVQ